MNRVKYDNYFKRRYNLVVSLLDIVDSSICLLTFGEHLSHFGFSYMLNVTKKIAVEKQRKYTGLSLSLCVKDICAGRVKIETVKKIISNTCAKTENDWKELIDVYTNYFWYDYPKEAKEVVNELRKSKRIEQPRLKGKDTRNIANGHWLDSDGELI